jgi:glutamate-1-semialdehyde 2,1-aminomutase
MINMHVLRGPIRSPDDTDRSNKRALDVLHLDLLAKGFYVARRGFIVLSLPMGDAELDGLVAAMDEVLADRAPLLQAI